MKITRTTLLFLFIISLLISFCQNSNQKSKLQMINRSILNKTDALQLANEELKAYLIDLNQYHEDNLLQLDYFERTAKESTENERPILTVNYKLKKELKEKYDDYTYLNYKFEIKVFFNTDENIKKLFERQSNLNKADFEITITNFFFGRKRNITGVDQHSIYSKIDLLGVHNSLTLDKIALNEDESEKLSEFLKDLSLDSLKESYINKGVEDGTQIQFDIRIGEHEKGIYISNYWQEDLGNLVKLIVSFLEEDHIAYYE